MFNYKKGVKCMKGLGMPPVYTKRLNHGPIHSQTTTHHLVQGDVHTLTVLLLQADDERVKTTKCSTIKIFRFAFHKEHHACLGWTAM